MYKIKFFKPQSNLTVSFRANLLNFLQQRVFLDCMAHFTSLSHSTYNFLGGRFMRNCRKVPFQQPTERFSGFPSPSTLSQTVHRRCFCCESQYYQQNAFFDFDLLYFKVILSFSCFCTDKIFTSFFLCSVLFNFICFILTLLFVQFITFSRGNRAAICLGKSCYLGLSSVILLFV